MRPRRAPFKAIFRFCLLVIALLAAGYPGRGGGGAGAQEAATTPRFAYVANSNDNTVSLYAVNATTGQLRHNGYVTAGTNPNSVTVDPSGKFAYVANDGSASVSAFTINAATGALTAVTGSPFAAGTNPFSVTVDPSG